VFHWRPQFIGKRQDLGPLADPHGAPARGSAGSLLRLAGFFVDHWLGYILDVRPRLVRSGLVIFDRYFDDITIDSKRYRYGGPSWLPKALTRLVPRPDMVVVLDADVERVLARKREVQAEEMSRLRKRYLDFAGCESRAVIITTDEGVGETSLAIRRALADRMNHRFEHRLSNWIAPTQLS
jgi:thymidylate kinase